MLFPIECILYLYYGQIPCQQQGRNLSHWCLRVLLLNKAKDVPKLKIVGSDHKIGHLWMGARPNVMGG